MTSRHRPFWAVLILIWSCTFTAEAAELEFRMFSGVEPSLFPNSILIMGEEEAVLVDGQWWLSEGEKLADLIEETGRRLKAVLITHDHPDHYMGLNPVLKRFPDARVLAREPVRDEIKYAFQSKRRHWQEMVPAETMPEEPVIPEIYTGHSIELEGHEILFVDLPPAETIEATAFYIPSAKALIPGDLMFADSHSYFADVDNPDLWIEALEYLRNATGPVETIYPGHGPVRGPELFDELIGYMKDYKEVAQPGVRVPEIAREMTRRYPDYKGRILLWLTRGPGFGLYGAEEMSVPAELLPPPQD